MEEKASEKQVKFMRSLGVQNPESYTKATAKKVIEEALNKKLEAPSVGPSFKAPVEHKANGQTAMYVSYVKDLFIAMLQREDLKGVPIAVHIDEAIDMIKQAKKEFE